MKTYNKRLQQKLEDLIADAGSQSAASKIIGYSSATIGLYLKSNYNGDVDKLEAALSEYFGVADAADKMDASASGEYVETSISTGVYDTIRICHLKGGLAVECGDAGIGKTRAAVKYVEDYPETAMYAVCNPCVASITAMLKMLCRSLRLQIGSRDEMWYRLADVLGGGHRVLIIDEAQHLPLKTIDTLRSLYDVNPMLGIVLIGNLETVTVRGGRQHEGFAQIVNRTKLTEVRHTYHIQSEDIRMLFPALVGCRKETELMLQIARSEQGIRGAVNLYSNAVDNGDTTYDGLMAMANAMHIVVH